MPNGAPIPTSEEDRTFWNWIWVNHPRVAELLGKDPNFKASDWYRYYIENIYTPPAAPPRRVRLEDYSLTESNWRLLWQLSSDPARVERTLRTWISSGYITEGQATKIWADFDAEIRERQVMMIHGTYELPEERERRLKRQEAERIAREQAEITGPLTWPTYVTRPKPFTEYGPALEEMRTEFAEEMPKTERWRDWFRSKYPRIIEQFEAKPEAERTKATWAEYLRKRKPEIREEWYGLTPFEKGERPSAYRPRIQTVGF